MYYTGAHVPVEKALVWDAESLKTNGTSDQYYVEKDGEPREELPHSSLSFNELTVSFAVQDAFYRVPEMIGVIKAKTLGSEGLRPRSGERPGRLLGVMFHSFTFISKLRFEPTRTRQFRTG